MRSEAASGLILIASAALALLAANSTIAPVYFRTLETHVGGLTVLHWINDALMALFFLLIGLEVKRELLDGELQSWRRRMLPGIAAASGMAVPALFYLALNAGSAETLRGWAIPAATDIAFALGVLALLGSRVPASLKLFLMTVAILDDLGAVLIIAIFYTADVVWPWLGAAALILLVLVILNRARPHWLSAYLVLGLALWVCVFQSGVHATMAGVALAFTIPLRRSPGKREDLLSPLHRLEHALQSWVAFLIVPLFGFANAGVSLAGLSVASIAAPITLGIAVGLFLGKQIGVFLAVWTAIKLRLADCPAGASLAQVYGIGLLCGIGFTMSLFIGLLAFPAPPEAQAQVKIGVLLGSLLSAVAGVIVLMLARPERTARLAEV